MDDSVFYASISDLSARLRKREFSSQELTKAFCDRLEKLGPRYNALALPLREHAIRKAKDVDRDLKKERFRSPLQGIPYGAKDLLSFAGQPTAWGAAPFARQVLNEDATVIKKLDKLGAVLIGKLAMVELAGGPAYRFAAASATGPGLNPWDRTRWSGGSSSGSGSAVAAGLVGYALGSETSGSILTPSAFCGITGLRPTYGLVSRAGAMALSWTLDKIGPMARTAEDCGLILQAIAGKDGDDPGSAGKGYYYAPQYVRPFSEMTLGFHPSDWDTHADAAARPALQAALAAIRGLGFQVKEVEIPDFPYGPVISTILGGEAGSIFEDLIASGNVDKLADAKQIAGLKATQDILARDYLKAMRIRTLIRRAFQDLFYPVDILISPARNGIAGKVADPLDRPAPGSAAASGAPAPKSRGLQGLIPAANLAGLPALCLPCGFADKMPVAIQLVGRAFSENLLLAVGRQYQTQTDFHKQHPPVG
ncbi:MAG: amidase [Acidobacteria bacterium]|nr:amidase [Acidobacteriota bacterium]